MKSYSPGSRFTPRILFCLLAAVAPAAAGTLSGVVRNGTTSSIVAGQDVILIELQGGMQPVETVQADAQGRYVFNRPELGQGPALVRAPYRGVNYHQNVPPGIATADIEVFEPTATLASLALVNHAIIARPDAGTLFVGEEFSIHNLSKPPATYFSDKGTFNFVIPDGATLREVSAAGPAGMPLSQGTIDKGKNRYAIAFALKPGENTIRVSYQLPYTGNQATVSAVTPLAAQRVVLAGPTGVQVAAEGFAAAGNEQGYTFYSHDAVPANSPVVITISGSASPVSAAGGGDARDAGNASSAPESATVTPFPPRVAGVQWILVAGFSMLFALGVFYLWRQPRTSTVAAAAGSAENFQAPGIEPAAGGPRRKRERAASRASEQNVAPAPASPVAAPPLAASISAADVNRDVRLSLDELKDSLFRLELRHQAGTIADDEYAREHSRLESVLRTLVRG
jgi:hypothetical protein